MSRKLRWGDFDMQAWKWLKRNMLGQSDPYVNGKRYDEGVDWRTRYELETLEKCREASLKDLMRDTSLEGQLQ